MTPFVLALKYISEEVGVEDVTGDEVKEREVDASNEVIGDEVTRAVVIGEVVSNTEVTETDVRSIEVIGDDVIGAVVAGDEVTEREVRCKDVSGDVVKSEEV